MPKKFKGENSKAAEAKARKNAREQEAADRAEKERLDELWKDDDKHIARKLQRKVLFQFWLLVNNFQIIL